MILGMLTLVYTGCKKDDDTSAPVISLNGSSTMEIELQEAYVEPGATANDDEDGDVDVSIAGTVNSNLKGDYTILYTATDAAGNSSTVERTVTVVNSADFLGGTYTNAVDSCASSPISTFNATVATSNTVNGVFSISNFGAFGNSITVSALYNSSTDAITISTPVSLGGGSNLTNVYASSGVVSTSPAKFKIYYQWSDSGGATDICTSTYTK
jgi:trimeric autotransporter adhesin